MLNKPYENVRGSSEPPGNSDVSSEEQTVRAATKYQFNFKSRLGQQTGRKTGGVSSTVSRLDKILYGKQTTNS